MPVREAGRHAALDGAVARRTTFALAVAGVVTALVALVALLGHVLDQLDDRASPK